MQGCAAVGVGRVRSRACCEVAGGLGVVEEDGGGAAGAGARGGDHEGGAGVAHHERQPLGRVVEVDGQVGGARLEHREEGHYEVGAAAHADGDEVFGADAFGDEVVGEPVGALVELGVGEAGGAFGDGGGVGGAAYLLFEELGYERLRRGCIRRRYGRGHAGFGGERHHCLPACAVRAARPASRSPARARAVAGSRSRSSWGVSWRSSRPTGWAGGGGGEGGGGGPGGERVERGGGGEVADQGVKGSGEFVADVVVEFEALGGGADGRGEDGGEFGAGGGQFAVAVAGLQVLPGGVELRELLGG
ncbi:hypothetical protein GCM10020000_52630 [Streptomyces olivoverticillatus]